MFVTCHVIQQYNKPHSNKRSLFTNTLNMNLHYRPSIFWRKEDLILQSLHSSNSLVTLYVFSDLWFDDLDFILLSPGTSHKHQNIQNTFMIFFCLLHSIPAGNARGVNCASAFTSIRFQPVAFSPFFRLWVTVFWHNHRKGE